VNAPIRAAAHVRALEDMGGLDAPAQRLHPLTKLVTTVGFAAVVTSYGRYDILPLLPLLLYPVALAALSGVTLSYVAKRVAALLPLFLLVGILQPLFDRTPAALGPIALTGGWLIFASLTLKGGLCVAAAVLLMANTGVTGVARALRLIHVPKLLTLELLLTYRYLSLFLEEAGRVILAYHMRAPRQRGVHRGAWGSLVGQMLLRALDRAERCHQAMLLRGFDGAYPLSRPSCFRAADVIYLSVWGLFFAAARGWDLPALLGNALRN
jgi:cobalt/nickel transport system permease protein